MENEKNFVRPDSTIARIFNHFVPRDARIRDVVAYALLDGTGLGVSGLAVQFWINQNPKMAYVCLVEIPVTVFAHIIVRRSTNLKGEPWR